MKKKGLWRKNEPKLAGADARIFKLLHLLSCRWTWARLMSAADASFKSHQRYYISVLPSFKIKVHPQQCDRSILTINTSRYENNHKRLFAKKCFRLIPTTPAKEADYNLIQTHDLCMQMLPLEIQLLTFSPYLQSALICSLCDSHSNNTFTQTHIFLGEPSLWSCAGLGRPLRPT